MIIPICLMSRATFLISILRSPLLQVFYYQWFSFARNKTFDSEPIIHWKYIGCNIFSISERFEKPGRKLLTPGPPTPKQSVLKSVSTHRLSWKVVWENDCTVFVFSPNFGRERIPEENWRKCEIWTWGLEQRHRFPQWRFARKKSQI